MTLKAGDHVTYIDINLRNYRGKIIAIYPQLHGGDCRVEWTQPARYTSEECLFNLSKIEEN